MFGNVASDPKVGNFDWITDFDDIESFLESRFTGLDHSKKDEIRVLVSGCGTSILSIQLADLGFGEIVSVDNDSECINHMKLLHGNDSRLKWITYDMVDPASTSTVNLGMFNLIVDKGTLDAILVEGAIFTMLHEVHRMLKVGGVYIVFSLNSENLLAPLLGTAALGLDITCHKINKKRIKLATENHTHMNDGDSLDESDSVLGTVVICKKKIDMFVDLERLAEEEKAVMDNYFKVELPYLTSEQEQKIRENFEGAFLSSKYDTDHNSAVIGSREAVLNDNWRLSLYEAYNAMFEGEDNLEYSYDLFQEDIASYPLENEDYMTVTEALAFLQMMQ